MMSLTFLVCRRCDHFVGIRCCLVDRGVSRPGQVPHYLVVSEEFVEVVEEITLASFALLETLRLDAFVFDALAQMVFLGHSER